MKKIIFLYALIFYSSLSMPKQEQVKIYAFYTPSHKVFVDEWFLPSLQKFNEYELVLDCFDQSCKTGQFMQHGWIQTMLHKIDLIIRGIEECWGEIFIHADVDIQFLRASKKLILELMEGKDILVQINSPRNLCAGFFACRGNERTLKLWQAIRESVIKNPKYNDQDYLNNFLNQGKFGVIWDKLPPSFFCGGTYTGKRWKPGQRLEIPSDIIIHHANWTVGVPNKIEQLKYVVSKFEELNKDG